MKATPFKKHLFDKDRPARKAKRPGLLREIALFSQDSSSQQFRRIALQWVTFVRQL
jgi:hypothetical protein